MNERKSGVLWWLNEITYKKLPFQIQNEELFNCPRLWETQLCWVETKTKLEGKSVC